MNEEVVTRCILFYMLYTNTVEEIVTKHLDKEQTVLSALRERNWYNETEKPLKNRKTKMYAL